MINNSYLKSILFLLTILLMVSCDNDFNAMETDIIGDNNFIFGTKEAENVVAFNQSIGAVQSSNLPVNSLGIYTNPAFGTTTANFVTQVVLASENPAIDAALHPAIESVVLTIPYFIDASKTVTNTDGSHTYTLDSIYGPKESKLKLGVYESKYFLRDLDPITQETQLYYSNQNDLFETYKGQILNDDALKSQNDEFYFSNEEYVEQTTVDGKTTTTRTPPGMRLKLNKDFFTNKFFGTAVNGQLANNNLFKNYFKGLYFKVEKSGTSASNLAMLNFKGGTITIKYKQDASTSDSSEANRVEKSIVLNLTGNCVNLFQNDYLPSYTSEINAPNSTDGDKKLYLKGGEGSMTIINLFGADVDGNGIADKLEQLRVNKWLVNDASLTFTIDNSNLTDEPNRIYLYDLNNKKQLIDYTADVTTRTSQKYNKYVYGGIIEKDASGKGLSYKIKLTNHIRNLIKNDTVTNVKLGLVVTENINDATNKKLASPVFSGKINYIPTSSVTNPLGTILYGSNIPLGNTDYDKRLKFEIYYTKPKQN